MIDSKTIKQAIDVEVPSEMIFDDLGLVSMVHSPKLLTFLDTQCFITQAQDNPNIIAAFVTGDLSKYLANSKVYPIVVENPKWCFYSLMNYLGQMHYTNNSSIISPSATISPGAYVAEHNVIIGERSIIEPGVTILPDVEIGDDCIIRAGATVGASGFEHKRIGQTILSVFHDGKVIIGNRVEIGPNNTVIKGFQIRQTIIGDDTKFDALVHFAHGAQIGKRCLVAAQAMIAGSVNIGDDVWIGPCASVSNQLNIGNSAFITMGAVVLKDVPSNGSAIGGVVLSKRSFS